VFLSLTKSITFRPEPVRRSILTDVVADFVAFARISLFLSTISKMKFAANSVSLVDLALNFGRRGTKAGCAKGRGIMSDKVTVVDVTPRDGLQNEANPVATQDKLRLIEKLVQAGIKQIQATSFVHPRWVPQMADAEAVAAELGKFPDVKFSALVPNLKGYERAVAAGIRYHEFVVAASDTFNHKNLNRSGAQSLDLLKEVTRRAKQDGVEVRVGVSTSFHCPFEGKICSRSLLSLLKAVREQSQWRIALCDTDGMAFPDQITETVILLREELKLLPCELVLHFHDTYGRGLANAYAGLQAGVREYDATTAGLGGCPYCPGASGNLATEDLVALLHGLGFETGIDLEKLLDAAEFAIQFSSHPYEGHLLRAHRAGACGVAAVPGNARPL
jgi:hydroxymethylglutaryl-CoA lyase